MNIVADPRKYGEPHQRFKPVRDVRKFRHSSQQAFPDDYYEDEGWDSDYDEDWHDDYYEEDASDGGGKEFFIGCVLVPATMYFLYYNEIEKYRRKQGINEVFAKLQYIPDSNMAPGRTLVHKNAPIHVQGNLNAKASSTRVLDDYFVIEPNSEHVHDVMENLVFLIRCVEMYQWHEKKSYKGTGKDKRRTYTYSRGWYDTAQDSSQFAHKIGHINPPMRIHSAQHRAHPPSVGSSFILDGDLSEIALNRVREQSLDLDPQSYTVKDGNAKWKPAQTGKYWYLNAPPSVRPMQVGDYRVTFKVIPPQPVSVVAKHGGVVFRVCGGKPEEFVELKKFTTTSHSSVEDVQPGKNI